MNCSEYICMSGGTGNIRCSMSDLAEDSLVIAANEDAASSEMVQSAEVITISRDNNPCNSTWYELTNNEWTCTCITPWQVTEGDKPEWLIHAAVAKWGYLYGMYDPLQIATAELVWSTWDIGYLWGENSHVQSAMGVGPHFWMVGKELIQIALL